MMLLLVLGLSGCKDKGSDSADAYCLDAPTVTWESHGEALLTQWCQPCHAADAPNRHGAPEGVTFDTEAEALSFRERILAVATSEDPTMPPSILVPDEDLYRLEVWLRCAE